MTMGLLQSVYLIALFLTHITNTIRFVLSETKLVTQNEACLLSPLRVIALL